MFSVPSNTRIFLHRQPTDMRRGLPGLLALTESVLQQNPLSGHLFVFTNRSRDRIKILYWGGTGFCLWYQLLEKGTYQLPDPESLAEQTQVELSRSQLACILEGIDLTAIRQRTRFRLEDQSPARCFPEIEMPLPGPAVTF